MGWLREAGRAAIIGMACWLSLTGCTRTATPPTRAIVAPPRPTPPAIPTFTIQFKPFPDVGKTMERRVKNSQVLTKRITTADGKMTQENLSLRSEQIFTETVLEKGEAQPRKFKRFYVKAVEFMDKQERILPYEGRTVFFELKGSGYEATVEGQPEVPEKDLVALAQRVTRKDLVEAYLPKHPVKVEESWKLDLDRMVKMMPPGGALDLPTSSAEAKLLKVAVDPSNQLFGTIQITMKLAARSMFDLKFETPGLLELDGTLETAIGASSTAGSVSLSGRFTGKGYRGPDNAKIYEDCTMEVATKEERSAEK